MASTSWDGSTGDENFYLQLGSNPIRFEPVSSTTNVFYDDANHQVFAVRSGGATGVICKGRKDSLSHSLMMQDKGPALSIIKFSPNQKILAVQRTTYSVEFMNYSPETSENLVEYSQASKNRNAAILGFIWVSSNEVLFITKCGLELYQVFPEKRMLKYLKNISVTIDWFLHSPESNIVVIFSSPSGSLQPYQIKPGNIYKYPRLDVDLASASKTSERDVSIVALYNQTAVLILRHKPKSSTCSGAEIDVYPLDREKSITKSHVLKLDTSGRFAINVIDNLIVVHHQTSKTSILFDVRISEGFDGYSSYHQPVVLPMPIKPFTYKFPASSDSDEVQCDLYSENWVVFQPDIVIDAKLGFLWSLELKLMPIVNIVPDKIRLVEFLLQRTNGKKYLLQFLRKKVLSPQNIDMPTIATIFDKLNENYQSFLNYEIQAHLALPVSGKPSESNFVPKGCILVDQQDMYSSIFSTFANKENMSDKLIVCIVTEYIRSLTEFSIPVQHYIYELLINSLVRQKAYYQLHQFLQYHVVSDSKPLACLLLSLEAIYPASYQLALDMFKRLGVANDLIVEILLNKHKTISAIRFVESCGRGGHMSARKFLDAAKKTGDKSTYFSVFKYFEQRNIKLRGYPNFEPNDLCQPYVEYFKELFGVDTACSNVCSE